MKYHKFNLTEGLRPLDLIGLIYPTFGIDLYKSKMGEDQDICVLSFVSKDRGPAKDLMEFVEKGFNFVLDADVSSGETESGNYFIFIELPRTSKLAEHIDDLIYGIKKLTGIEKWKFRYYKDKNLYDLNYNIINEVVPDSPFKYKQLLNSIKTEELKSFFNKTLMDDFSLEDNIITIHKPYNQKLKFMIIKDDTTNSILEDIDEPINVDESSMSQIFWLTKVLGDYNISKVGENFMFENNNRSMILKRVFN